jgi:hypothetical protein
MKLKRTSKAEAFRVGMQELEESDDKAWEGGGEMEV